MLSRLAIEQGDFKANVDAAQVTRTFIPAYTGVQLVSDTLRNRVDLFDRFRDLWELVFPTLIVESRLP